MASFRTIFAAGFGLALASSPACAAIINFQFNATLQTGTLSGTTFVGNGSYDNAQSTGIGTEYLTLYSLSFYLDGATFTRSAIKQGGQVILQNGALSDFTAAFFPPPPATNTVSDIAFGFGGPGIIGYVTAPGQVFGQGAYTASPIPAPEAGGDLLLLFGLLALTAFRPRRDRDDILEHHEPRCRSFRICRPGVRFGRHSRPRIPIGKSAQEILSAAGQ